MNRSSKRKFKVFEFDDRDNGVERCNHKFRGRLELLKANKKRRRDYSPITKYHFLQSFAGGTKNGEQASTEPIDVDAKVIQETESKTVEALDIDSSEPLNYCPDKRQPIATAAAEISSVATATTHSSSLSFCTPQNKVLLEKQLIDLDCKAYEIDDDNKTVEVFPDFIVYQDISFVETRLTFSSNGIKLEGSASDVTRRIFCSEWAKKDVTKIESNWNESVATAMICLHLRSNNSKRSGNGNKTSGVEQLIFVVYDPHWSEGEEAIRSLDGRYREKWDTEIDMVSREKDFLCGSSFIAPKQHVSSSDKLFHDVIYPMGDPDAVIIHKKDLELLEPERFINDTIIDFYVKYLATNLQPEEKLKFHFFNSFFFRKLADLDKDRLSSYDCNAAFQRIRKWTMKVNIFEKDFIFIPVNYSFHWSLLVICYPGEVSDTKDGETENASKLPCILHMDSLRGSHKGLKNLIRSYLCQEWKEKHNDTSVSSKFADMEFIPLELPQQENLFDCGVFLLHYVECFLEEAPLNIAKLVNILNRNWFVPEEASRKRYQIKKLLYEIFEDQSKSRPEPDTINRYPSRIPDGTCDPECEVIFLEQINSSKKTHDHGVSPRCNIERVEVKSSSESSSDGYFRKPVSVSSELSEQGACSDTCTDANYLQSSTPQRTKEVEVIDEERVPESPLEMGYRDEAPKVKILRNHEVYSFLESPLHTDDKVSESLHLNTKDSDEGRHTPKKHGLSMHLRKLGVGVYINQQRKEIEKDKDVRAMIDLDNELVDCVVKDSDEDTEHEGNKFECFRLNGNRNRKRRCYSKGLFSSR